MTITLTHEKAKQPETLRLADGLEKIYGLKNEADELRRAHQSEREGWRYAAEVEHDRKRLHEVNAELVEALRLMNIECQHLHHAKKDQHGYDGICPVVERVKLSIAKATGE